MTTSLPDKQEEAKAEKSDEKVALPNGTSPDINGEQISGKDPATQPPDGPKDPAQRSPPEKPAAHPDDEPLRLAGRRRKKSESAHIQNSEQPEETKESPGRGKPVGQTQAEAVGKVPGRWSPEEHKRFLEGNPPRNNCAALAKFGKNWKQVEEYIGTRTGAQIRSHAQKYFNKLNKDQAAAQNAEKSQSQGQADPKPALNGQPDVQDRKSSSQSQKETLPTHTPLALQEYGTELTQHRELIESAQRVLTDLKTAKDADPLFAVKLNRGEELLNRLQVAVYELLLRARDMPDVRAACAKNAQSINDTLAVLREVSPELKDAKYSGYLHKIMYGWRGDMGRTTRYGIRRVHETAETFRTLSDWVDEARHVPSKGGHADKLAKAASFVRAGECKVDSITGLRHKLGKKEG